ncbi:nitrate reductase molybdenum cofactor assembly chaperone [Leeia oryzae]|uniref:nitrate reductase molybdenum cofactor assembly chaperone n=1 Tax=Leeia oryzae TaxID=356662 RepID=UPI0003801B20|nr:nitrate reductase molybdenum cofactor assembly chaperone [Leeia oryzae]
MSQVIYRVLSSLLCYPEGDLLDAIPEVAGALATYPKAQQALVPLLNYLESDSLLTLQENYVATFDRNPRHSLHLFEHIHGESRDRGQAMVDLLEEYRQHGFAATSDELPDYVPLFLEFLAQVDEETSSRLLGEAIHVLAMIGNKLEQNGSPYHHVFTVLRQLTPVEPLPLVEPPIRDMDEAMEQFGPSADGVEPLLKPGATQAMTFYPKGSAPTAGCHG